MEVAEKKEVAHEAHTFGVGRSSPHGGIDGDLRLACSG
jgi:hypothetical protein